GPRAPTHPARAARGLRALPHLRRGEAVSGEPAPSAARRRRRHDRRPRRGPLRAGPPDHRPRADGVAVSAVVRLVSAGAPLASGGHADAATIAGALAAAGLPAGAHIVVDDDEGALEQALTVEGVVAIVAGVGGSAGDSVRRVLSRITGARLLLSDR